ncbi:transporter substrate-binding domain-containing protein [Caryophanon latum]|uniref:ABC transporter substrate-binding protein n=1 Tax=Caryophanon latum TaxID=33977 RepID=A0A1C0YUH3_9BACL|nr:transporter substrate-binding domain-containing protein [Caryophanon latum]OCS90817.1 ABC transporter substrate-binding protein [Caryophanon latum]
MWKSSRVLMLMLIVTVVLVACSKEEEQVVSEAKVEQKEPFKVGLEADYPPFNWTQATEANGAVKLDGSFEYAGGYDVEVAKEVVEALGKELVLVKTEWDDLIPNLEAGKIDAIIAGMSPTAERKERIDFSDTYYASDFVIVTKGDSPYAKARTLADFQGAKITAQLNTTLYNVIDQMANVQKQAAMESFAVMREAVEQGTIDGYVAERSEAISATAAYDTFTYIEFEQGFDVEPEELSIAIGVRKGYEHLDEINSALSTLTEIDQQMFMVQAISNTPVTQ